MLIIGLTGSIGMGKSTAAAHLRAHGISVFDADAEVHRLYAGGEAVERIEQAFPGTTHDGAVDRDRLSAALVAHPEGFATLEGIVHPLVRAAERNFLRAEAERGAKVSVLEIPLLYETGAEKLVDAVIVVSASADVQRQRLSKRPGLTPEKLESLLARQTSDADKRVRANYVVDTGGSLAASQAALDAIVAEFPSLHARAYTEHWA